MGRLRGDFIPRPNGTTYDLSGEYGIGYTSNGEPFYFDKEDFPLIVPYSWWIDKKGYVCATISDHKNIKQHRLILHCTDNVVVDHIYHKLNDNRKSQIRIATRQENQRNQKVNKANTSGKTGVCLNKKNGKWRAYITIMNKQKSLGHFENYDEAVQARIKAEKEMFGSFRYKGSDSIAELS